ncbi:MAG TPA: 2-phospho-L-lactate guanylyltransferase [Acidimicrobiales bacterium]|nr:2-phospho-L-lactate guanylyltransferase [Acidimicrobiales bacterium]
MTRAAVLVPVKAFAAAKVRLAPALSAGERAALARTMAERVVAAAAPMPVFVACDDDGVADWARGVGADVEWTPGLGLNGAVQQGLASLVAEGFDLVVVAHADLPHASGLMRVARFDGRVTIVPDRHDDGTNVIVVPAWVAAAGFTFAYGVGSFRRHIAEAERIGSSVHVERLPELQWDVDTPDDLPARLAN